MRIRNAALAPLAVVLALPGAAQAAAMVVFDKGPGTGGPPARLDGVSMRKFPRDTRKLSSKVTTVKAPRGSITFSRSAVLDVVKNMDRNGYWKTWSNGYAGNVYFVAGTLTITLPSGTTAFYLYAEPNSQQTFEVTASSGRITSGPIGVGGTGGAKFFGFIATGGARLHTVHVSTSDSRGFAVGEFGIHRLP